MLHLLVITDTEPMLRPLGDLLSPAFNLTLCSPASAGTLLRSNPQGLIIDLPFSGIDGLTFLEEIRPFLPPVILVLTNVITPYLESVFADLGVGYVIRKPCLPACVAHRVEDMFRRSPLQPDPQRDALSYHLKRLGLRADRLGTMYLRMAIPLFASNRHQTLSKDIYPLITAQTGATDDSIHAAMHAVILTAWKKRDDALWQEYFPDTSRCPPNREFIATLSDYV